MFTVRHYKYFHGAVVTTWTGVDTSTALLPAGVPETAADPMSLAG